MSGYTPGPWGWLIHDYSMAYLGRLPNPGLGDPLVLAIGPCEACAACAEPKEWKWGRCHVPSEEDAGMIAAAPDLLAALIILHRAVIVQCVEPQDMERAVAAIAKATAPRSLQPLGGGGE